MQGLARIIMAFVVIYFDCWLHCTFKFYSLLMQVYWPDDKDWYTGVISKYDAETGKHRV